MRIVNCFRISWHDLRGILYFCDGLPGLRFTWSCHQRHPDRWQPVLSKRTKQRRSDTYRNQDWVNTIIVTTCKWWTMMNILYHTVMLTFPGSPNNLGCSTRLDDAVQCCAQRIWKWECENVRIVRIVRIVRQKDIEHWTASTETACWRSWKVLKSHGVLKAVSVFVVGGASVAGSGRTPAE